MLPALGAPATASHASTAGRTCGEDCQVLSVLQLPAVHGGRAADTAARPALRQDNWLLQSPQVTGSFTAPQLRAVVTERNQVAEG